MVEDIDDAPMLDELFSGGGQTEDGSFYDKMNTDRLARRRPRRPQTKSIPAPPSTGESYFATCERDEQGRCLPKGESGQSGKERDPKLSPHSTPNVRRFGSVPAPVSVRHPEDSESLHRSIKKLFPKANHDQAEEYYGYLSLAVGAPEDASVEVLEVVESDDMDKVVLRLDYPAIELCVRTLKVDHRTGKRSIHNDLLEIYKQHRGAGLGMRIFGKQVENAIEMGFDHIATHAAGNAYSDATNGYYTWPALGYDQDLPSLLHDHPHLREPVDKYFPQATCLREVMMARTLPVTDQELEDANYILEEIHNRMGKPYTPRSTLDGDKWWQVHGGDMYHARFDLREGSWSRWMLNKYLEKKAAQKKALGNMDSEQHGYDDPDLTYEDLEILDAIWRELHNTSSGKVQHKSIPTPPSTGESYFASCERDEQGHCLPKGESSAGSAEEPEEVYYGDEAEEEAPDPEISPYDTPLRRRYTHPPAPVRYDLSLKNDLHQALQKIFHDREEGPDELLSEVSLLTGAPEDASVRIVGVETSPSQCDIYAEVDHPNLQACSRRISLDRYTGQRYIYNDLLIVRKGTAPKGFGSEVFARQVEHGVANGMSHIETLAVGKMGSPLNGYYTWPRLGYNQPLAKFSRTNAGLLRAMKERFPKAESIRDVMMTASVEMPEEEAQDIRERLQDLDKEQGREPKDYRVISGMDWWKANGDGLAHAVFDLRDKSWSRYILEKYLTESEAAGKAKSITNSDRHHDDIDLSAEQEGALDRIWKELQNTSSGKVQHKSIPTPPSTGESYFASCERDEQGRCLPKSEQGGASSEEPTQGKDPVDVEDSRKDPEISPYPTPLKRRYEGPAAPVLIDKANKKELIQFLGKLFPDQAGDESKLLDALSQVSGAPEDAKVYVGYVNEDDEVVEVKTIVMHPMLADCERLITLDKKTGNRYLYNSLLFLSDSTPGGRGVGSGIFARQVEHAVIHKFSHIETSAVGRMGSESNGYYTWPRLGYNQDLDELDLPAKTRKSVAEYFPEATCVRDVILTQRVDLPEEERSQIRENLQDLDRALGKKPRDYENISGSDWWKIHGRTVRKARFDLREGSWSRYMLEQYMTGLEQSGASKSLDDRESTHYEDIELDARQEEVLDQVIARLQREYKKPGTVSSGEPHTKGMRHRKVSEVWRARSGRPHRAVGEVWQGPSGRWFTMLPGNKVAPARAPKSTGPEGPESDRVEVPEHEVVQPLPPHSSIPVDIRECLEQEIVTSDNESVDLRDTYKKLMTSIPLTAGEVETLPRALPCLSRQAIVQAFRNAVGLGDSPEVDEQIDSLITSLIEYVSDEQSLIGDSVQKLVVQKIRSGEMLDVEDITALPSYLEQLTAEEVQELYQFVVKELLKSDPAVLHWSRYLRNLIARVEK